jgi:hypothetical protein
LRAEVSNAQQLEHAIRQMEGIDEGYSAFGAIAWDAMSNGMRDQLRQLLFQGPVWDGNVISKSDRDDLINLRLATRCCFLGEQGYTAATYMAYSVFKRGRGEFIVKKAGTSC